MSKRRRSPSPNSPTKSRSSSKMEQGYFNLRRRSPVSLIAFYDGTGKDIKGRSLAEILQWPASRLESCHDYIQTLFPLPEKSAFNDPAPIIDKEVFEAFRTRMELRGRMRDSFERIMWFYGFQLQRDANGKLEVCPGPNFPKHSRHWHTGFNHNHLRITRIIRSLRVLGLEEEALAFYNAVAGANKISPKSRMFWARAAHRPLNIPPDLDEEDADEADERLGPKFLWDFEQKQKAEDKAREEAQNKTKAGVQEGASGAVTEETGRRADAIDETDQSPETVSEKSKDNKAGSIPSVKDDEDDNS